MASLSTSVAAKSLRSSDIPAEYPPASYKGSEYVDSRGCVYLRAGFAGKVTWVPRVSRARKLVCGYQTTFANKPEAKKDENKVAAVAKKPAAQKPVKRPLFGAPVNTVATTPAVVSARPRVETSQPKPVAPVKQAVKETPKPQPRKKVVERQVQTSCPGASSISQKYMTSASGFAVRCGPQQDPVRTAKRAAYSKQETTRSTPVAAPVTQVRAPVAPIRVPKGYRAAWEDDRLNPNRAKGTAEGRASMNQVWTQKPPRQQIAHVAPQRANTATSYRAGGQYVQVGTFGVPSNAQRTARRLSGMNLPVVSRKMTRGGRSYTVVSAGPFADAAALRSALQTARRAGFSDAFIR